MKRKTTEPKRMTYEQAQETMTELCALETQQKQLQATIEAEQNAIVETYQPELMAVVSDIANKRALLETYANEHKDQWPKKTLALMSGRLSFTTTPHRLVLPDGKNEDDILDMLEDRYPQYTSTTVTIDRKTIITMRDEPDVKKMLARTGMTIVQDEKFNCKPNVQKQTA